MSMVFRKSALVFALAGLCLGAPAARAQSGPVQYWLPGWPIGFSTDPGVVQSLDSYGNVPSFTTSGSNTGFFSRSYSVTNNWSSLSGVGLSSNIVNRYGSLGSYTTQGAQYGYTFKNGVSFYGGFDTLKFNPGVGGPFATFDSRSTSTPAYAINGGVEFKPSSNVSLSLGFSYAGQSSSRVDSDINSPALPGETPQAFTSGRR
ncbi:outer membrane protein [Bradyrhizobium sp. HKCCYLS2038]|uniref:outer membrane protein n=1 Tax=unclassified Bradyrhizobium TaxID=2631580 RepID=UPI003EB6DA6F